MADHSDSHSGQVLQCMEIWGGNRFFDKNVSTPGLDVWVSSRPFEQAQHGGDVYYMSLCGAGAITRILLADVSGHGSAVAETAKSLRTLVRKNINSKTQTRLVESLNREFSALSTHGRFATAVVATYLTKGDRLNVCNAGHPRPFLFQSTTGQWSVLSERRPEKTAGLANLPLGIVDEMAYTQFEMKLERGDMVLFYTDALTEAESPQGRLLGESGLLELLQTVDPASPAAIPAALSKSVAQFRGERPATDDQTFVLVHHNAGHPRTLSIRESLSVYAKVLGLKAT